MPIKVQGTEIITNDRKLINLEGAAVTGIVTSLVAGTGINISGATGRVTISASGEATQEVPNVLPDYNNDGIYDITDALSFLYGLKTPTVSIANTTNNAGLNFFGIDPLREGIGAQQYSGGFSLFTQNSTYNYYDNFISALPETGMVFGSSENFTFTQVEIDGNGGPITGGFNMNALFSRYPQLEIRGSVGIGSTVIANSNVGIGTNIITNRLQIGNGSIGFQGGNIRIGDNTGTGSNNTLALNNIFIGNAAGELSCYSTDDKDNIHIGSGAGRCSGKGSGIVRRNLFLGYQAGYGSTTGTNNIHIGVCAGAESFASGSNNIAIGCDAGCAINGGNSNVFIGEGAGRYNLSGECSVVIGYGAAALGDKAGTSNVIIGHQAGYNFYDDVLDSVIIGTRAGGFAGFTGISSCNVYIGYTAGGASSGNLSVHIGYNAGCASNGSNNVGIGYSAGLQMSGNCNISLGYEAGRGLDPNLATGGNNISLGFRSGYKITSGSANISIGRLAGCGVTDGQSNIFMGQYAGCCNSTGDNNNIIGYFAGRNSTGGDSNNFLGTQAGRYNTIGNCNNFIGFFAGTNNTTGTCNVFIGTNAGTGNITGSNNIFINNNGSDTSNATCIGNSNTVSTFTFGDFTSEGSITSYSDESLKENIERIQNALEKARNLEGVTYNRNDYPDRPKHMGLIAQCVRNVIPEVTHETDGKLTIAYGNLIALAIEAIKDLDKENQDLKLRVIQLENIVGISSGSSQ